MKLDIARDAQKLATSDPYFSELILKIGLPRERYREPTLATLIHIIVSQQISLTAADSIWRKFNCNTMTKFIAFEGIDGSGKSTQLKLLAKSLELKGIKFICTREPGGSNISEQIRKILVTKQKENILPLTELLLIYAARYEHLKKKIIPNVKFSIKK